MDCIGRSRFERLAVSFCVCLSSWAASSAMTLGSASSFHPPKRLHVHSAEAIAAEAGETCAPVFLQAVRLYMAETRMPGGPTLAGLLCPSVCLLAIFSC